LSTESFNLANDPTVFPDQLKLVETSTQTPIFNTSWWFYGSKESLMPLTKLI
jgi:hypothetical protein